MTPNDLIDRLKQMQSAYGVPTSLFIEEAVKKLEAYKGLVEIITDTESSGSLFDDEYRVSDAIKHIYENNL